MSEEWQTWYAREMAAMGMAYGPAPTPEQREIMHVVAERPPLRVLGEEESMAFLDMLRERGS